MKPSAIRPARNLRDKAIDRSLPFGLGNARGNAFVGDDARIVLGQRDKDQKYRCGPSCGRYRGRRTARPRPGAPPPAAPGAGSAPYRPAAAAAEIASSTKTKTCRSRMRSNREIGVANEKPRQRQRDDRGDEDRQRSGLRRGFPPGTQTISPRGPGFGGANGIRDAVAVCLRDHHQSSPRRRHRPTNRRRRKSRHPATAP